MTEKSQGVINIGRLPVIHRSQFAVEPSHIAIRMGRHEQRFAGCMWLAGEDDSWMAQRGRGLSDAVRWALQFVRVFPKYLGVIN